MKTNIYFTASGVVRQLSTDTFMSHEQVVEQLTLGGLTPDDKRVLLTYTKLKGE